MKGYNPDLFDIAFVILNYNVYNETVECVTSIMRCIDTDNTYILIVDNLSPDKSGERLREKYKNEPKIEVIINNDNLGYAKGNNAGINYIRDNKGGARFICCINNDTLIDQRNMYSLLNKTFCSDSSIAVIGPRIYDRYYLEHAGMGGLMTISAYKKLAEDAKKRQKKPRVIDSQVLWKRRLLENNLIYDMNLARREVEKKIKQKYGLSSNKRKYYDNVTFSEQWHGEISGKYDTILHGCCLFFTPAFFEALEGFDPATFMYGEEPILFIDIISKGLHTFRADCIHIRHIEDVSADATFSLKERRRFRHEHEIESMQILINKMERYGIGNG